MLGVGCTPKSEVIVPSAAVRAKTTKVVVKKLRAKEMNPDDRQIKDWSIELKKSHEIFREVWAHIWEDRLQSPMSVFFEIERLMNAHKNPVDGHFLAKSVHCPGRATEIELQRNALGVIQGAVFYRLNCVGASVGQDRIEIARVQKNGRAQIWTYYAEHMSRAAGQSMAFLREKITCESKLDDRERMTFLNCRNLGQNRDTELHLIFSQFRYQKNSATLVQVEGKKFKLLTTPVCDSEKFCTQLKVPVAGSIEIFEDTVSDQVRQERKQAQLEKERAEQAKASEEAHQKFVAEMQKKAGQPTLSQTLPPGAAMNPQNSIVGAVVPGQVMNAEPTAEPQFGEPMANPQAQGVPAFDPAPVGADGVARDPVLEFAHAQPAPMDPEEMRQRMGQPDVKVQMIPREAAIPIER